ncbi:beta-N-acetylhexosaminidase [Gallibacterium salpingitidis]|uniref:beta-N-acetylhexosaminidase n=1 Tax=Gallibacterium salpingitidis TaxID=505341 RepID=UPI0026709740|nr:beta-N-acetylhexosaminidase [Gallibacterium salpingitidis]WKT00211.1 beta-N-acetylhexosaminidase [Gallibacterium salpingitidis]
MAKLIVDLQGTVLEQEEVEILNHPLVAGVILFTRNFVDISQLRELIKHIRQKVKHPLLITVDQEGGRVQRFRQGFTQLPAIQAFARLLPTVEEQQYWAKESAWLMAAEMIAMDIDLSFAPVLDVGHQCKAIGDRSFHQDWQQVLPLAEAFCDGMLQAGMATTGKHFPGHGHVVADSHLETPKDERSTSQIFQQDIQPFQQLIDRNKLKAIMPAHVIYTQADERPASGSPYWLKEILREKLGFKGIIFSDDLGMKGAGVMGSFVERSRQALAAGCNILLLCNERAGVIEVLDNLVYQPTEQEKTAYLQLAKRQHFSLSELQATSRWVNAHHSLTNLQQKWLEVKG